MEVYTSEKEQIEQLKSLWKNYGIPTLVGIVIALFVSYGWRYWQALHERALAHASVRYEQLLTNVANHNTTGITQYADYLIKRYPKTNYAKLAAFLLAHEDVYEKNYDAAETQLNWAVKTGRNPLLRQIARIRLARLLLAENKPKQALTTLQKMDDKNYQPLIDEVKGDIYLVLKQPEEAHRAYGHAVQNFPDIVAMRPLLQIKMDNL